MHPVEPRGFPGRPVINACVNIPSLQISCDVVSVAVAFGEQTYCGVEPNFSHGDLKGLEEKGCLWLQP